jgi:hypothetical protein
VAQGPAEFSRAQKLGMNWRWEECGGWWMCTASLDFVRGRQYVGCLAIPRSASYGPSGGEKNCVRSLWSALAVSADAKCHLNADEECQLNAEAGCPS